ncbi:MAG: hypothetical protein ACI9QD_001034 [Thermoproteota archaeon]|jgi:hypothetical protein
MGVKRSEIRKELIENMSLKEKAGLNCFSCKSAECCTFVRNSMMITVVETFELYSYLVDQNLFNDELINKLEETISHYRLEKEIPSNGRKTFARRSYTCPFLAQAPLACMISRQSKPYGCLGFNAMTIKALDATDCRSEEGKLEDIVSNFGATLESWNKWLEDEYKLGFIKLPIPNALLKLHALSLSKVEIDTALDKLEA